MSEQQSRAIGWCREHGFMAVAFGTGDIQMVVPYTERVGQEIIYGIEYQVVPATVRDIREALGY